MPKKCKNPDCKKPVKEWGLQVSSFQKCCSIPCSVIHARLEREKAERRDTRERKRANKTKSQWRDEAQVAFNRWIVYRDRNQPCISCDKPANDRTNYWDCGHYRSVGATPELRFEESNAHKQCKQCNRPNYGLSGNIVEYRIRLKVRIGPARLNWLEGPHEMPGLGKTPTLTIDDYKRLKKRYTDKLRECKSNDKSRTV